MRYEPAVCRNTTCDRILSSCSIANGEVYCSQECMMQDLTQNHRGSPLLDEIDDDD